MHGVELPPASDVPVKAANHEREQFGTFTASGGVYLVQPFFNNNAAFTTSGFGSTRQTDFNNRLEVMPAIWIGYAHERGWGVRGRWLYFDHDAHAAGASGPGETLRLVTPFAIGQTPLPGTVASTSGLAVHVADLEATWQHETARWCHLVGFGVRWTQIGQDYQATLFNPATQIDAASSHFFNGWGPCASYEARRRIGETGFSIYGQAHAAILFGHTRESYFVNAGGVGQQFARRNSDVIPVGELEVGGQYQHYVGRATLFLQAGFVGQIWWGAGSASNLDPLTFSSAADNNFGFLGIALRAGVRY